MKFKDTKYGDLTGQTYKGDINVSGMELTSLKGVPKEVQEDFYCSTNQLTTLKGTPKEIQVEFYCFDNPNLKEEWELRKENTNMTEDEIKSKMFDLTNDENYLPKEAQDIFLF